VLKKYVQDGDYLVDCDIWAENAKGEQSSTPGNATIVVVAKKKKH